MTSPHKNNPEWVAVAPLAIEMEAIYNSAPIGLCVIDRDLRYLRINEWLARMNGRSVEEHIGRSVREMVPMVAEQTEALIIRVFETGAPVLNIEVYGRVLEQPELPFVVRVNCFPLKDAGGRVVAASFVIQEVTPQWLAERSLRETLDRLSIAEKAARACTFEWNLTTGQVVWSEGAESVLGWPLHLRPGRIADWECCVLPEDASRVLTEVRAGLADGRETMEVEYRTLTPSGEQRWLFSRIQAYRDEAGTPIRIAGINVDITQRKHMEAELRRREAEFRGLLDNSPDYVTRLDRQYRHTYINPAAAKAAGLAVEAFLGKSDWELGLPAHILEQEKLHCDQVFATGREVIYELNLDPGGTPRWIEARLIPEFAEDGTVESILAVSREITRYKTAQRLLEGARSELEVKVAERTTELRRLATELSMAGLRERRRIASELHDELQQLLASCRLRLDALREQTLPVPVVGSIDQICGILDRAIRETRALTFRLANPVLNQFGLGPALKDLCETTTAEYGVPFDFADDGEPKPLSDHCRDVVYRCVRELVINVVRHSGARRARISLLHVGAFARVVVSDDGKGFDVERAGLGFSRTGGFGLFHAREELQACGARIEFRSQPGFGTSVVVEVPLLGQEGSDETYH
jgi:PAS domain S-box-containing protein